jgi:hypothetical protein
MSLAAGVVRSPILRPAFCMGLRIAGSDRTGPSGSGRAFPAPGSNDQDLRTNVGGVFQPNTAPPLLGHAATQAFAQ